MHLTWSGAGPKYRVLRSVADGMPEKLADTDKPEYVDDSAQFGMRYQYLALAFADETQQSLASDPAAMPTLVDTFAPDVPAGITAVAGVNTIELEWERNTESDFKGYNVFRSVDGAPFEKVASLIEAPTYSDTNVQTGKTYRYAVIRSGPCRERKRPIGAGASRAAVMRVRYSESQCALLRFWRSYS